MRLLRAFLFPALCLVVMIMLLDPEWLVLLLVTDSGHGENWSFQIQKLVQSQLRAKARECTDRESQVFLPGHTAEWGQYMRQGGTSGGKWELSCTVTLQEDFFEYFIY